MPKDKIPTLGAVAAANADEKTKAKRLGLLASIASALGLGSDAVPTAGKMRKVTETHKHVKLEEEEGGTDSGEEEEEEEAMDSESDMDSDADSESSKSDAEEEEEEEEGEAKGGEYEEEEEEASVKGLGSALRAAYRSPEVKAAFLAAVPKHLRAAASLRTPDRLVREVRKSTGAKTIDGAMTALSRQRATAAKGDAKVIKALAKVEQKVSAVESGQRAQRVEAIVQKAKEEGKATTKDLRSKLRAYGVNHGTKALKAFVATLPKIRTVEDGEKIARTDAQGNALGAPSLEAQMREMAAADLSGDERRKYDEIRATVAAARNGANGAMRGF